MEEIRKAASLIPGYGPPDIAFPAAFRGRWQVQSKVVDVKTPLGDAAMKLDEYKAAMVLLGKEAPVAFEARFLDVDGGGGILIANEKSDGVALSANAYSGTVIADRAFNAERRAAAQPGAAALQDYSARWDPTNPNVLTLACRGSLVEVCVRARLALRASRMSLTVPSLTRRAQTKVTKRSYESPFDGAFGTSEYARIADAGSEGVVTAVPKILASRVQTRYKWDAATADGVRQIEALELQQIYDPTQTGFADLAGATPVLTIKSRLILTR